MDPCLLQSRSQHFTRAYPSSSANWSKCLVNEWLTIKLIDVSTLFAIYVVGCHVTFSQMAVMSCPVNEHNDEVRSSVSLGTGHSWARGWVCCAVGGHRPSGYNCRRAAASAYSLKGGDLWLRIGRPLNFLWLQPSTTKFFRKSCSYDLVPLD